MSEKKRCPCDLPGGCDNPGCDRYDRFDPAREAEWSHATALGEAVWLRMCGAQKKDPKDAALASLHDQVVGYVRDAAFVIETDGFDGLADWLELEEVLEK